MLTAIGVEQAADARRAAYEGLVEAGGTVSGAARLATPPLMSPERSDGDRARAVPFAASIRAVKETHAPSGKELYHLEGFATIYGKPYEMYDMFGPYEEQVDEKSGVETLASHPDVAFLTNHRGVTMARTTAETLVLSNQTREDGEYGLHTDAWLNPGRTDVKDLIHAIDDKAITEMSFAFMLLEGRWNDAFTLYTITKFDIDRGDVSAVNYGANPYTSIAARSNEILSALRMLPTGAAREAWARLASRSDVDSTPKSKRKTKHAKPVDGGPVEVTVVPKMVTQSPSPTMVEAVSASTSTLATVQRGPVGRTVTAIEDLLAD